MTAEKKKRAPQPRGSNKRRKAGPDQCTAFELRCVLLHEGSDIEAYEAAGGKSGSQNAYRLFARERVKKALRKKHDSMVVESGKRAARKIDIGRNEIIMLAADIARSGESESARVSALGQLITVFGLSAKNDKDTDLFAGWSQEELDSYALTGELPERVRSGVLPSESAPPVPPNRSE